MLPAIAAAIAVSACTSSIDTTGLAPVGEGAAAPSLGLTSDLPQPQARQTSESTLAATDSLPAGDSVATGVESSTDAGTVVATAETRDALANEAVLTESPLTGADPATARIAVANAAPVAGTPQNAVGIATGAVAPENQQGQTLQLASAAPAPTAPAAPAGIAAATPIAATTATEPRRTGVFRSLFSRERVSPPAAVPQPAAAPSPEAESAPVQVAALVEPEAQPEPEPETRRVIATASARGSGSALPGFDRDRAFGINVNDPPADIESRLGTRSETRIEVASAAGLARLAPNGLRTQHSGVDVKCLKPALVRVLKQVERKYGTAPVITSGYRSPERNRRARGAKNSLHMYCAAADIQVPGVDKWSLASYLRSMPGRGGVGTYCHTKSVHVDIGPRRDWNARCRRR